MAPNLKSLREEIERLRAEIERLRDDYQRGFNHGYEAASKRYAGLPESVEQALNEGDGTYRP